LASLVDAFVVVDFHEIVSKPKNPGERPSAVRTLAFAHGSPLLAFGGLADVIELWYVDGFEEPPHSLGMLGRGHAGDINAVAFSPDGSILASASDEGEVGLWATPTPSALSDAHQRLLRDSSAVSDDLELLGMVKAHPNDVTDLSWSWDGKLATSAQDQTVHIHSVYVNSTQRTARLSLEATYQHNVDVLYSVDFHPNHTGMLVSGALSNEARGWRAKEDLNLDDPERFLMNCTSLFRGSG
jgi:WD40 repeat protein